MAEMSVALKTAKEIEKQLVVSENRLAFIKDEVEQAKKTKDALDAEIAKKSTDYNIYMAQKDSEIKGLRKELNDDRAKLEQDKHEFQGILQKFQQERAQFLEQKHIVENQNAQHEEKMNQIRQFVIAVQRACSVIGL